MKGTEDMNLKQQREAALKAARDIAERVKAEGRGFTEEERKELDGHLAKADSLAEQIKAAEESDALMKRLGSYGAPENGDREAVAAKSLGEHFVNSVGTEGLAKLKAVGGTTVATPEWQMKAATDTQATPAPLAPWLTTYDQTIVRSFRRPVVSDLFGQGAIGANSNAVTYLVEGAFEGAFGTVAEGGAKPQFHIADPTTRTDALRKIAGFIKFTDEMVEDAQFWVSEVNQRGIYNLALTEEAQLLSGDGLGANLVGLLNRSGIQLYTQTRDATTGAATESAADALFKALSLVQTATGLDADGIVINPADYQALRLAKDANDQYYGGGYFAGQYGTDGIEWQPPIWGRRTVVSAAVPAGTAIVGAFGAASTVYRKGGVRVESTNSHASDFTNNLITTRIEERLALAVRIPAAFVNVDLV
jgi:HK97 family phage major capsid protein